MVIGLKLLTEKPIIDRIVSSHTRYGPVSLSEDYRAIIEIYRTVELNPVEILHG
jgi:hypothetical protein